MFKSKLKIIINYLLAIFNLKIVNSIKSGPFDLTNKDYNFFTSQYLFDNHQFIINIDLSIGRTNNWFIMSNDSLDPPIFAIREALKKNLTSDTFYSDILSTLKEHRSLTTFSNAGEFLDLEPDFDENLKKYPWWAEVNPWDNHTFDDQIKNFPYEVKKNRERNGMQIISDDPDEIIRLDLEDSLPSHAMQYSKLTEKIRKNGFQYGGAYGYVTAEILIANNQIRWKPGREGNHRVAAASALGLKNIPVLVTKVIRLEELEYWPNVINGTFKEDQATKIFYNIFEARPSKIHQKWIKKKSH